MKAGSLQRIADVYVPYQFYEVSYVMARAPQTRLFAMDVVDGSLDLFEFPEIPGQQHLLTLDTRNRIAPSLPETAADELLREKALARYFSAGFFQSAGSFAEIRTSTRTWCTCRTGWDFTPRAKSCVAA